MDPEKILFVDDEANILAGFERQLHHRFAIDTALSGEAALQSLAEKGPYAVIVSDMRMPVMDGIQLLRKVRDIAPDTVRIMLTGNSELQTAVDAVNEGNIFRFLNKPCPPELLEKALADGLQQYRLITAERELLNKTLNGSVRMLMEILTIVDPQSFGYAEKLRVVVKAVAREMRLIPSWELEAAAMLCQIGMVTLPPVLIKNIKEGRLLTPAEKKMIENIPEIGRRLLDKIPRLEPVARIVMYQNKHFDGSGLPDDDVAGLDIPVEARILKVTNDLLRIVDLGVEQEKALSIMGKRTGWYDPEAFLAITGCKLEEYFSHSLGATTVVKVRDLQPGMVLAENYENTEGVLLVAAGNRLSETIIAKIQNVAEYYDRDDYAVIKNEFFL